MSVQRHRQLIGNAQEDVVFHYIYSDLFWPVWLLFSYRSCKVIENYYHWIIYRYWTSKFSFLWVQSESKIYFAITLLGNSTVHLRIRLLCIQNFGNKLIFKQKVDIKYKMHNTTIIIVLWFASLKITKSS